jgi:hypothetical protein
VAVEFVSETFTPHVGDAFELQPPEGEPFEAVLSSCTETPYGSPEEWKDAIERVPFALLFHALGADGSGPQGIYTLRHADLGEFELFVVPHGPDERGMRYGAVVS